MNYEEKFLGIVIIFFILSVIGLILAILLENFILGGICFVILAITLSILLSKWGKKNK